MVERFSNSHNPNGLGFSNGIEPDGNGSYVRFEDYAALTARLSALEALLDKGMETLEPFAEFIADTSPVWDDERRIASLNYDFDKLTLKLFRAARSTLTAIQEARHAGN